MGYKVHRYFIFCVFIFFSGVIYAKNTDQYFCSTKFNYVNVREYPNFDSRVKFVYIRKNEPVKVIGSFGNWKKIVDVEKHEGWVFHTTLSDKRYVVILSKDPKILYDNFVTKTIKAFICNSVRCKLLSSNSKWCKIHVNGHQGWISNLDLWGVE